MFRGISHWISNPFRPELRRYEWVIMRLLCVIPLWPTVVKGALPHWTNRVSPNGISQWVDLSFASNPLFQAWWVPLMVVCMVFYVIGFLPILSTLGLLLGHILLGTLLNSLGAIHHTGQVLGLVLIGQLLAHLVHLLKKDPNLETNDAKKFRVIQYYKGFLKARPLDLATDDQPHQRWVSYSQQLLAVGYVASGISKIIASGGEWISTIPRIALQFEKTKWSRYYDHLDIPNNPIGEKASLLISQYPEIAKVLFGTGLFLEFFCFVALIGRLPSLLWGVGLLALHESISHLMGLGFGNHKWLLVIFFINIPYWITRLFFKQKSLI